MAKIERLKEITGNETIGFTDADIEDDFDPQKYDKLMQVRFTIFSMSTFLMAADF